MQESLFTQMHNNGIDAVVRKIEIEYKTSLRGGDTFLSCLRVEKGCQIHFSSGYNTF